MKPHFITITVRVASEIDVDEARRLFGITETLKERTQTEAQQFVDNLTEMVEVRR